MNPLQDCRLCPRLSSYRREQKIIYPEYACRPVAALGDAKVSLLIVGLAPGLHGANATGKPFTGDASGEFLFKTLYKFGFASQAHSRDDTARLFGCRLTNAVKCVPPQNRPNGDEINRCNSYLRAEISALKPKAILLALGGIAHRSIIKALELRQSSHPFAHLAEYALPEGQRLIDSYHCSRYNQNTGRLDQTRFEQVFERIEQLLR